MVTLVFGAIDDGLLLACLHLFHLFHSSFFLPLLLRLLILYVSMCVCVSFFPFALLRFGFV